MKRDNKESKKEICVECGKDTEYNVDTPINLRFAYIKGEGQLCLNCYNERFGVF